MPSSVTPFLPLTGDLRGSVVVTGGSHGITKAFSFALAGAKANVAILRNESEEEEVKKLIDSIKKEFPNARVKAYECDACDFDRTYETLKRIDGDNDLGKFHGVITNADTSVIKPAVELSKEDFREVYGNNVYGVFNVSRAAAKIWENDNREGSIVITASMSAQIINQAARNKPLTQAFYNSSMAAARNLARALAAEWAEKRIRVNSLSPGYVNTHDGRVDKDKDIIEHQERNIPLRRFAEPNEVAGQALLLLSPHASYMTGGDYLVDGGQLIW